MVKRLDEALGRLLDALKSLGQLDNTIVLFTCDHGNHFKTRNGEYKRSCHDASLRVPTAFSGPGFNGGGALTPAHQPRGSPSHASRRRRYRRARAHGRSLDPAATRRPPFAGLAGRNFRPDQREPDRPLRAPPTAGNTASAPPAKTLRGSPISVAGSDVYADDFLYDLLADPWELNNLIGYPTHRAVVEKMRERLVRRWSRSAKLPRGSPTRRLDNRFNKEFRLTKISL
jgi:hypothetical protein